MKIEKVYKSDYCIVKKFLNENLQLPRAAATKEPWKPLFDIHWKREFDHVGYILLDGDTIVGFLGTIFATYILENKEYKFCNVTSWVVKDAYRNQSMSLLFPILQLKNYVITNLTPSKKVADIFLKLGFRELESSQKIMIPSLSSLKYLFSKNLEIICDDIAGIKNILNDDARQILLDHQYYDCKHFVLKDHEGNYTYIICTKVFRKNITFGYIHYISNLEIFGKYIDYIKLMMSKCLGVFAIIVDARLLKDINMGCAFTRKLDAPKLYKGGELPPDRIRNIYSEHILLNV